MKATLMDTMCNIIYRSYVICVNPPYKMKIDVLIHVFHVQSNSPCLVKLVIVVLFKIGATTWMI
jgi:hypothetical protein